MTDTDKERTLALLAMARGEVSDSLNWALAAAHIDAAVELINRAHPNDKEHEEAAQAFIAKIEDALLTSAKEGRAVFAERNHLVHELRNLLGAEYYKAMDVERKRMTNKVAEALKGF